MGEARTFLDAGYLLRLRLNRTRRQIAVTDSALEDKVADNPNKFHITESETLLFDRGFGVGTDIQTGRNYQQGSLILKRRAPSVGPSNKF